MEARESSRRARARPYPSVSRELCHHFSQHMTISQEVHHPAGRTNLDERVSTSEEKILLDLDVPTGKCEVHVAARKLAKTRGKTLRSVQADSAGNDRDKRDCGNLRMTLSVPKREFATGWEKPQHFLWMMVSQTCRALLSRSTSTACCGRQDKSSNLYRGIARNCEHTCLVPLVAAPRVKDQFHTTLLLRNASMRLGYRKNILSYPPSRAISTGMC